MINEVSSVRCGQPVGASLHVRDGVPSPVHPSPAAREHAHARPETTTKQQRGGAAGVQVRLPARSYVPAG